ncbi:FAD-binding protein [Leucobacter weissii]|uniref:FAD-binding protein n=1 Tax=Leucobacter weissii TaxID=1983706 RepID=A0A939S757_9MICO|nr:FAD-linked oxidase C-terminal domain-containing protein [Leucobacter weissii]MBO1903069.1 FAD-binding protein [Leucobacter weissii]
MHATERSRSAVVEDLRAALGAEQVVDDADRLARLAADRSGTVQGAATALVLPRSTAEVQEIVRIADRHAAPIVAQGARTSLAGAASAVAGAILVDFGGMNRILRIDPLERLAVVEPGVLVSELAAAAERAGLFYAPDPVSAEWATIGGTIATNAGGMRCIKYGVTRDSVRSLEVVLADGSVVRTRRDTIKSVTGLDLTSLVVGSEGTLGLVTEATVTLRSAPGPSRGVSALFPRIDDALEAAAAVATEAAPPAVLEMLDDVALTAIRAHDPTIEAPASARAWLLAVTDARVGAEEELDAFERIFSEHRALRVDRADDPQRLDRLFATRRALNPALDAYTGGALHGDIAVPRGRLGAFAARAADISRSFGVIVSVGGHVGDGNLHPVVAYDPDDAEQARLAREAQRALLSAAQELGGTVSGEHGVGTEKLHALDGELSPRVRELQLAVKRAFDPKGILNPGRKL